MDNIFGLLCVVLKGKKMNDLDLQVLKEALETLDEQEGEDVENAKTALTKIIYTWDRHCLGGNDNG